MPSRTDGGRRLEAGARTLALLVVVALAWRSGEGRGAPAVRGSEGLVDALRQATRQAPAELHVQADSIPGAAERAWLRALRDAGTPVTWTRDSQAPPLVATEVVPGPERRVRIAMLDAPAGGGLHDAVGRLAEAPLGPQPLQEVDAVPAGSVQARSSGGLALATPAPDTSTPRALVLARAGWEGRFVAQGLRDAGWAVETDFLVNSAQAGQAASVRSRGARAPNSSVSVVIALDETAAPRAGALAAWVRAGGGLLLGPDALAVPGLAALSPAGLGPRVDGSLGGLNSRTPRRGLDRHALGLRDEAAVAVEREGEVVRVAARRVELGRVGVIAYRDTWRWRMEGDAGAPEAHAAWWSAMAGAVAAPPAAAEPSPADDPAPLASMVDALGPPAERGRATDMFPATSIDAILLSLACLALLVAWWARRARGLP